VGLFRRKSTTHPLSYPEVGRMGLLNPKLLVKEGERLVVLTERALQIAPSVDRREAEPMSRPMCARWYGTAPRQELEDLVTHAFQVGVAFAIVEERDYPSLPPGITSIWIQAAMEPLPGPELPEYVNKSEVGDVYFLMRYARDAGHYLRRMGPTEEDRIIERCFFGTG
jgi:hypothetical protein